MSKVDGPTDDAGRAVPDGSNRSAERITDNGRSVIADRADDFAECVADGVPERVADPAKGAPFIVNRRRARRAITR